MINTTAQRSVSTYPLLNAVIIQSWQKRCKHCVLCAHVHNAANDIQTRRTIRRTHFFRSLCVLHEVQADGTH